MPHGAGSPAAAGSTEPPESCRFSLELNACSASVAAELDDGMSSFSVQLGRRKHADGSSVVASAMNMFAKTAQRVVERGRAAHTGRVIVYSKVDAARWSCG